MGKKNFNVNVYGELSESRIIRILRIGADYGVLVYHRFLLAVSNQQSDKNVR